jgi:hypothetical protein
VLVLVCGDGVRRDAMAGFTLTRPKLGLPAGSSRLLVGSALRMFRRSLVKTHEGWMLHDDLGGRERVHEALALELLTSFGMLEVAA